MNHTKLPYLFAVSLLICLQFFLVQACKKKNTTDTPEPIIEVPEDTTMFFFPATNANIQYTGRIDFSSPLKPDFSYPGVSVKAQFEGKAIDVVIKDYGTGGATTTNYFTILIDGALHKIVKVNATDTVYKAARELTDAVHTIEVVRRTEASVGKSSFRGFQLRAQKQLTALSAKPSRKVEFIGDSFTCGYGNDISYASGTNTGFHSVNENNYTAWGAIVCRTLQTQYHCTAYSGRGMYRNNSGSTTGTLPGIYNLLHPDAASPVWNTADYVPDLIVIHLGTNDFFPESWASPSMVDSAVFVNTYKTFLTTLRGYYPSAEIVCVVPNSMSNYYPVGFRSLDRIRNYVDAAVDYAHGQGDANVHFFELATQTAPYGEDWHPSNATHQSMANQITPFLKTVMGW